MRSSYCHHNLWNKPIANKEEIQLFKEWSNLTGPPGSETNWLCDLNKSLWASVSSSIKWKITNVPSDLSLTGELQSRSFWDIGFACGKAPLDNIHIINLVINNLHVSIWFFSTNENI